MSEIPLWGHCLPPDDPVRNGRDFPPITPQSRFELRRNAQGRLELADRLHPANRSLHCNWFDADMTRRIAAGRGQPLARACGLHKTTDLHIVDATAGLGRDALCLAALGARLTLQERHPVLHALIEDALTTISEKLRARISLLDRDSRLADWPPSDVIFLDPMFPRAGKRAAPGLAMQIMQLLIGEDEDAEALIAHALAAPVRRVVLKRPPRGARVRIGTPDLSYGGGRAVYEVYLRA